MSMLFDSIKIRDIEFRNRIFVSPMCQYSAVDGFPDDWHLVHLGTRAVGGAALVFTEATAVLPEGRISLGDLGLWKEEHIAPLKRITDFIHLQGAVAGIQLAHAGRKASVEAPWNGGGPVGSDRGGWEVQGPSALAFKQGDHVPNEMSVSDIAAVTEAFRIAAERSAKAGFKVVEIHAAHGYLIHEFLSPLSNRRTDEYGGDFSNRIRLLLEVVRAVRTSWPAELPLFVRISASDWVEGGWTDDDSVELAKRLKNEGVDFIDCSSGGNVSHVKIPVGPLYQVPFAEKVKKGSGMLTGAVGLITTAHEAEDVLRSGKADAVMLARQLLRDPYFPLHAAKELGDKIKWPVQYERAG